MSNRAEREDADGPVSSWGDDVLADHDAVALAALVAGGDVSALELVEAAIARAQLVDPRLNAVAVADYERARRVASNGCPAGAFAGVPTFIKDAVTVAGLPSRFGSRAMPDEPATTSSPQVRQLEATGVVNLGLTTLPEFGLTATTEPALTGVTRNPWSLAHSTGGSSGGTAALVAAGVVPLAHGNDGGGSIRIPASCCGIVGLKPSRGRIPHDPLPKVLPVDLAADGVLTRTVRDTAAYLHAAEEFERNPRLEPVGHVTAPTRRRLRIGVITERVDGVGLDSDNQHEILRVAADLEGLGHDVELTPNPVGAQFVDDFFLLWSFIPFLLWHGGRRAFGPGWDRDRLEPWTRSLVRHFRRHAASAPAAFRRMRRFAREYSSIYDRHDVLLSTTLGAPLHEIGYLSTELPGAVHLARATAHVPTTPPHNVGGGPAISLPLATDRKDLPMGMHFAADVGGEATLLGLALQLEQAHPWATLRDV